MQVAEQIGGRAVRYYMAGQVGRAIGHGRGRGYHFSAVQYGSAWVKIAPKEATRMMRAYVLIESAVGKANSVGEGVKKLSFSDAKVISVDAVTGPFDVIALLE